MEQGDRRRHAVKMVFVHVIDLNSSGCGGQKQLPAVLQLAVEPGQAIVVCVDVVHCFGSHLQLHHSFMWCICTYALSFVCLRIPVLMLCCRLAAASTAVLMAAALTVRIEF